MNESSPIKLDARERRIVRGLFKELNNTSEGGNFIIGSDEAHALEGWRQ
jgi:hypothetical protein